MKICALIPVHNESKAIGKVIDLIKKKNLDVVVVNDGSTDGSGDIAKKRGAIVLTNKPRQGKGFSLRQGFLYAVDNKYDGVITLDGDGQHSVDDIDGFLNVKADVGIVVGNRMHNLEGMPWIRIVTNRFMSNLISWACKQKIPDTQCGYRYISCDVLKSITLSCNDFEMETELLIEASKKGFKIDAAPIKTIYSDEESKINPFIDTFRFFSYFLKEILPF